MYVRIVQTAYVHVHVYVRPGAALCMRNLSITHVHYSSLDKKQNKINHENKFSLKTSLPFLGFCLSSYIHTGNLGLSKRILPFATSSVDDAGAHFLAF